jgi:hypothetical protein
MKLVRWVFVLGVLLAFVAYVWPTRWRYDHMTIDSEQCPVRIDRINGRADVLLPGDGWTPVEDALDNSDDKPPTDTVS